LGSASVGGGVCIRRRQRSMRGPRHGLAGRAQRLGRQVGNSASRAEPRCSGAILARNTSCIRRSELSERLDSPVRPARETKHAGPNRPALDSATSERPRSWHRADKRRCRWPCGAILRVASTYTTSTSTSLQPAEGDAASPISTVDGSASSRTDTADPATFGPETVCSSNLS
jgi:hypothetical protein